MDNLLQQGIAAVKSGDKARAFQLLTRATQDSTMAEQAWLWLSATVDADSERLFCLGNALRINPGNGAAQRGATTLQQKGVFPSPPMPPHTDLPVHRVSPQPASPQPTPAPQSLQKYAPPQTKAPTTSVASEGDRQDLSTLYRLVATELANKKLPQVIVKKLTDQGVTPAVASKIVAETQQALNEARGNKYRKQMIRGLLWTVAGGTITCLTYVFASNLGGQYVLCWGAVIFGIIDFLVGLFGWLSINRNNFFESSSFVFCISPLHKQNGLVDITPETVFHICAVFPSLHP